MSLKAIAEIDLRYTNRLRLKPEQRGLWRLTSFLAHSGDSWFWLAGLILIWWLGDAGWRYRAAALALSMVALAALVLVIKFTVRRRRPPGEWGTIYRNADPHSFPSGHAARAVLLAVLACSLGPSWFALVVGLWAPLVSLARVSMGVHYLSDVLAGMLVGALIGWAMVEAQALLPGLIPWVFDPQASLLFLGTNNILPVFL